MIVPLGVADGADPSWESAIISIGEAAPARRPGDSM